MQAIILILKTLNSFKKINLSFERSIIKVLITTRNSLFFNDKSKMMSLNLFCENDSKIFIQKQNLINVQYDDKSIQKLIDLTKDGDNYILTFKLEKVCKFLKYNELITIDEFSTLIKDFFHNESETLLLIDNINQEKNCFVIFRKFLHIISWLITF